MSVPEHETLGNWTDGRISCRHSAGGDMLSFLIAMLPQTAEPSEICSVFVDVVLHLRSDLLHQKDYAIRCLCDDKFNATLELLELFAKEEIFGGVSFMSRSSFFFVFYVLCRSWKALRESDHSSYFLLVAFLLFQCFVNTFVCCVLSPYSHLHRILKRKMRFQLYICTGTFYY